MADNQNRLEYILQWIQTTAKGVTPVYLDAITMAALEVVEAEKGFFRCNFTVPNLVSDSDGNWHVGAIATLIDCIGAAAIFSTVENMGVSLDFTVSYFATAKIEEQVEIEAKVEGSKGNLISAMVRIKKKESGQLIALGKLWMATTRFKLLKNSKL